MRSLFHLRSHKNLIQFSNPQPKSFRNSRQNPFLSPTHLNNLLNTTTQTRNTRYGTQIHAQMIVHGYTSFPFLLSNLINMYAKCGRIDESLCIFSNNPHNNIVTWTSIITHFSQTHKPLEALSIFSKMRTIGIQPNHFTFSVILPACGESALTVHGLQIHSLICKCGYEFNVFVGSALVDMYAKCEYLEAAKRVFDELPEKNLVSWNTMIVGFLQNKLYEEAIRVFQELIRVESFIPDEVSFSSVLSACANVGRLNFGKQVHVLVVKLGLKSLAYVKNSLIDMYSKCDSFEDAVKLFKTMKDRDVVTWNVMIMGWVQKDCFEEACNCFWVMRREGVSPDEASFSTALHAAASMASLDQGTLVHDQLIKTGFEKHLFVGSSLITMYAKCGSLDGATRVFKEIEDQNVVSWTAMIAACQQHGHGDRAIRLFEEMPAVGIEPDYTTFVCVLSACSHNGLIEKGFGYFDSMSRVHGMKPRSEHYACIVDMLGRAGRLDEAKKLIESMVVEPDPSVWGALLAACRNYRNLEMGREVAEKLFEMEPENPGNYVLLGNIYAHYGRLEEANELRKLMGVKGVRKEPGCSWIEVQNTSYVFTVHDKSHSRTNEIYEMLGKLAELAKKKGYVAETHHAINDLEEYKEQSLWYHSEKLALAFGLISLPVGAPIRIKKNLRTCGDCHTVMKLASDIFEREIIVRDINRFHQFTGGSCSCGDYW